MHPIVAHIHPSFRTAVTAWLVGRIALWLALHSVGISPLDATTASTTLGTWIAGVAELANTHVHSVSDAGAWLRFALNELVVLAGLIGLYRFVRHDAIPQGADRAVWFAALSPLMVLTQPGADWAWLFALSMWALELTAVAGTMVWGTLFFLAGVALRPELIVLWPGLAAVAWRSGSSSALGTWVATLVPVAAFSGRVLWEVLFGRPRSLYAAEVHWRSNLSWHGLEHHLPDLGILAVALFGIALAFAYVSRRPKAWIALALPCMIWPLLHDPSSHALGIMLLSASSFGHLGAFAEDPGRERIVLSASILGLIAMVVLG